MLVRRIARWLGLPPRRPVRCPGRVRAFLPSSTERIDAVEVGGCPFCVCALLLAGRSVAYVPWDPRLHLTSQAPLQKSKSVSREVATNANAQNQAQPDFPYRALISINNPHISAIYAMKASTSSLLTPPPFRLTPVRGGRAPPRSEGSSQNYIGN